jgi:hypothetical protein
VVRRKDLAQFRGGAFRIQRSAEVAEDIACVAHAGAGEVSLALVEVKACHFGERFGLLEIELCGFGLA